MIHLKRLAYGFLMCAGGLVVIFVLMALLLLIVQMGLAYPAPTIIAFVLFASYWVGRSVIH